MMVGPESQRLACVASQLIGIKRRCCMKPLTGNHQLGLVSPLNYTAIQTAKQKALYEEHGAWMQLTALGSHGEQWRGVFS
jgi:hypothetical protein